MPTHRRPRASSRSSMIRRATQSLWLPVFISAQVVAPGAPISFDILSGLATVFDVTNRDVVVQAFYGQTSSVPTVAPTTVANAGVLTCSVVKADKQLTAAQLDPTTTPGDIRDILYQRSWHQNLYAAPVALDWAIDPYRDVLIKAKRRVKSNEDTLWFCAGTNAATQTWQISFTGRLLVRVP